MAFIKDKWHTIKDGEQVRTARFGQGRRWLVRWREHGVEKSKAFTYKAEAERFAREVENTLDRGETPSAAPAAPDVMPTVREYATRWLAAQPYGPGAQVQRDVSVRNAILPTFGDLPLDAVTPAHVREWLAILSGAEATRLHRFRIFSSLMAAAVDDGLIVRNPVAARSVKPPKITRKVVEPWDAARLDAVRDALPEQYRLLVTLGAGLGLRSGEIFGLGVQDVDLKGGMVQVRRQVRLDASKQVFALPKYERTREVPLPGIVADAVREHLDKFPARIVTLPWASREARDNGEPHPVALLLTTRESGALNRNYVSSKLWRPALKAATVPQTRDNGMHVLRHTYASRLVAAGVGIPNVSRYLGHADTGFTLRTYAHAVPDAEQDARNVLDALLRP
ncbi:tyrosine-type recombinase/integrase [Demequina maris]|uniref:tyrosine-type recombinase/integrase n=1 Tax=Demequina maris TaxID=1638982 RepID=UPI00078031DE|nr:site-specific integrase [Demequina maris]